MEITVLHNQSLLDLALQHTGTIESVFELAEANALNITDDVVAGKTLVLPAEALINKDILAYYTAKNLQPATAFTKEDEQVFERLEGISIWAINLDFIVTKSIIFYHNNLWQEVFKIFSNSFMPRRLKNPHWKASKAPPK